MLGLYAQTKSFVASTIALVNPSTSDMGINDGSGSNPTHTKLRFDDDASLRRFKK